MSVMFPVIISVICTCYDSCLSSGYDSYYTCYGPLIVIVMYSCFDYRMNCNSDSIRLDLCGMRQRYIYEGFLVWIIPSMY